MNDAFETRHALHRAAPLALALVAACATSSHPTEPAKLGVARRSADLLAVIDRPGPLVVETIASADWAVDRSGLVNLDHPHARAAHLEDGAEPIQVYFHAIRHPERGTFIVDTGIERALRDAPDRAIFRGLLASVMKVDTMKVHVPLGDWLDRHGPITGVLLTHLHLDHVSGLPDVPKGTPIYSGPGEAASSAFLNLFVQGPTDEALDGHAAIGEWRFEPEPDGRFAGVLDVFGDGSLWAIWSPGHTPGSTAYLARTATGPVLFAGDTCHTAWGWLNAVEPGTFSADVERSRASFDALQALAAEHPALDVRLGHQPLARTSSVAQAGSAAVAK
jgi:N-acyl homoserine lactone hydrolase